MTASVDVGNPFGQPTQAIVVYGLSAGNTPLPTFGCTLLVANPAILAAIPLPAAGQTLSFPIPNNRLLCGIGVATQSIVADPTMGPPSWGASFSRGLLMLIGR